MSELLEKGYHDAPLEIHPQTTVIRRRGFENFEEVIPAFVKISTAFKGEMGIIDAVALKVWLYIALSINRNTGEAFPGARKIAKDCGINKDTVTAAIKRLEEYGLLTVRRANKKFNIYQVPSTYVSANKAVRLNRTDEKLSESEGNLSEQNPNLSEQPAGFLHNQRDQIQPDSTTATTTQNIFTVYSNNIGMLTPIIAESLQDAEDSYGPVWVCEAIQEAVKSEVRNWKYCEAILKRWKQQGFKSERVKSVQQSRPPKGSRADFLEQLESA